MTKTATKTKASIKAATSRKAKASTPKSKRGKAPKSATITELRPKASGVAMIPLSKIQQGPDNVRKDASPDADPTLMASIKALGVLQPIGVVALESGDSYEVVYGERRYLALRALAESGDIAADHDVPAVIQSFTGADRKTAQLAENVNRVQMSPVDELEAFAELRDAGLSAGEIAKRFGIAERAVLDRLALGSAAPEIREAFREGIIPLSVFKAFANCPDLERQLRVFHDARQNHFLGHKYVIERQLTEDAVMSNDATVRFIGLDTYEAEGGMVEANLLDEDKRILDVDLLYSLRDEKLQSIVTEVSQEGWKWAEVSSSYSGYTSGLRRIYGQDPEHTPEECQRLDAIETELLALSEAPTDADGNSTESDEERIQRYAKAQTLREEMDDIECLLDERPQIYTEEELQMAGAFIVYENGRANIVRGLVRPEDEPPTEVVNPDGTVTRSETVAGVRVEVTRGDDAMGTIVRAAGSAPTRKAQTSETSEEETKPVHTAALEHDLGVFRGQAIAGFLVDNPDEAAVFAQYLICEGVLMNGCIGDSTTMLRIGSARLGTSTDDLDQTPGAAIIRDFADKARTGDFEAMGHDMCKGELYRTFRKYSDQERRDLVALALAEATQKSDTGYSEGVISKTAGDDGIELRRYFLPTGRNYFSRIRKDEVLKILDACVGEDKRAKLVASSAKKADVVKVAEELFDGTIPVAPDAREKLDAWMPEGMAFAVSDPDEGNTEAETPQQSKGDVSGGDAPDEESKAVIVVTPADPAVSGPTSDLPTVH